MIFLFTERKYERLQVEKISFKFHHTVKKIVIFQYIGDGIF